MFTTKQRLRREVLARLKKAAAADPAQLRSAKLRQLLHPILKGNSLCIAIYAPLPHEVNLLPLMQEYPQHRFVFPRCIQDRKMSFHHVLSLENDMKPGAMGILEPAEHTPTVAPDEIDVLIVPGVAFTQEGQRLGYGGGYYDRYIPTCPAARILALAFNEQLVPEIPTEEHDYRIQEILTTRDTDLACQA